MPVFRHARGGPAVGSKFGGTGSLVAVSVVNRLSGRSVGTGNHGQQVTLNPGQFE